MIEPLRNRHVRPYAHRHVRSYADSEGALVAVELTELLDLTGWPPGMRVIVRRSGCPPARSCRSPTSTGGA